MRFTRLLLAILVALVPLIVAVQPADAATGDPVPTVTSSRFDVPHGGLTALSCTPSGFCMAVDGSGDYLIYSGTTWSGPKLFDSAAAVVYAGNTVGPGVSSLSCVSSTFCVAADTAGSAFRWDGTAWNAVGFLPRADSSIISCTSTTFCAATQGTEAATFDGASWTSGTQFDTASRVTALSCGSDGNCLAVNGQGDVWTLATGTWTKAGTALTAGPTPQVSCVASGWCLAVSGGQEQIWTSGTWSTPTSAPTLDALSCSTPNSCAGISNASGEVRTSAGWTEQAGVLPGAVGEVSSASCVSGSDCFASAGWGIMSHLSGSTWATAAEVNPTQGGLMSVTCPSTSFCLAVDQTGKSFAYNGSSWGQPTTVLDHGALWSVSCTSSSFCAAVGSEPTASGTQQLLMVERSGAWTTTPYSDAALSSISCASPTLCVAAADAGNNISWYEVWNGSTWIKVTDPAFANSAPALTCLPGKAYCYANDRWYDGSTWHQIIGADSYASPLSCWAPLQCDQIKVSTSSNFASTFRSLSGTTWTTTSPSTSGSPYKPYCFSSSFCVGFGLGVGYSGLNQPTYTESMSYALRRTTGTLVNLPHPVVDDAGTAFEFTSIACPSASLCVGVTPAGAAVIRLGTRPPSGSIALPTTRPRYGTYLTAKAAILGSPIPSVQWQRSTDGNHWSSIAGATHSSLKLHVLGNFYLRLMLRSDLGIATSRAVHVVAS